MERALANKGGIDITKDTSYEVTVATDDGLINTEKWDDFDVSEGVLRLWRGDFNLPNGLSDPPKEWRFIPLSRITKISAIKVV